MIDKTIPKLVVLMTVAALVLFFSLAPAVAAQDRQLPSKKQTVVRAVEAEASKPVIPSVFEGDLRDLPRALEPQPGEPEKEIPKITYPRGPSKGHKNGRSTEVPQGPDPLLDLQEDNDTGPSSEALHAISPPELNFPGQGYSFVQPPDTVGDVGLNYYIQMINATSGSRFTIYNKGDGSIAAGPINLDTLGTGNCAFGRGDPIVLWDPLAERWLLSEFSSTANALCVYISQTSDPIAGPWFNYEFPTPFFPDYPKYGVWPDAYYVSTNEPSPAVYAMDRTQMLSGNPATMQRFTAPSLAGFPFQALLPSDLDGALPPPAGSPNYFIRHRDDEVHNPGTNNPSMDFLEIWEFQVDFATPVNSTFTGPLNIPISEIDSDLCGLVSFSCFPQPAGPPLDPLREIVMWRLQYRNFGSHETMVGNLVTDVDGTDHGGIRWFELRKTGGGPWVLHQEGTYAPDDNHRWMGSIAMDKTGNIALGYSVSSTTVNPGIRYVGRLATDPLGTMPQGEFILVDGSGSNSSNRWGDYSSMNVDPVDDCTFWYTNEYGTAAGNWATQIGVFKFSGCAQEVVFEDLPPGYWAEEFIYKLYEAGITGGCSQDPLLYCPENPVTRAQMAVFLLSSKYGSDYTPPPATGIFDDVPAGSSFADWIEDLFNRGITGGCDTNPLRYCPDNPVTRAQMAVFLLSTKYGSDYTPPPATGIFDDVPAGSSFADWIEDLFNRGITGGCSQDPLLYCPDSSVTRAAMAVFLVVTFEL